MRESFQTELSKSGYLHTLLEPDASRALEARLMQKKVLRQRSLTPTRLEDWATQGQGRVEPAGSGWRLATPARIEPLQPMGHYTNYGHFIASTPIARENWEGYNRITCRIRPECNGLHAPHITLRIANDGEVKIPDVYQREGFHVVNLRNRQWNDCVWEFPDLPRDAVIELGFSVGSYGTERFAENEMRFEIADICLEQAEEPDVSLGWQGNEGAICYSTTGYWTEGSKTAVVQKRGGCFELLAETNDHVLFAGDLQPILNEKGEFGLADFSSFAQPGRYRLRAGGAITEPFTIAEHVMDEAAWKVLNFIYAERCGFPVGHGHAFCHGDLIAEHGGQRILYNGGWHDAGDVSQQTVQTGEVALALLELAQRAGDADPQLRARLMEEACWGLDFVLRTRFGDGYRAFSAGICRWTNGVMGDRDDEAARCHNRSFDNWLLCGVQAYAGTCLASEDADLSWVCIDTAKQDYAFALARFEEVGMENCVMMEHTYNASLSQYYAVASWSASMLYQACGEPYYAEQAAHFGESMIACQDIGEARIALSGFFYRDETKKHVVHFNHQGREYIFAQALVALCSTQKEHPGHARWEEALRAYGAYLKAIAGYAAPYGMLPAGVHHLSEVEDEETFAQLHVYTNYAADRDNYRAQLEAGAPLGNGFCLRQFPVWFSFRGNTAVQLSVAKGAALCGRYWGDRELLDIARDQAYWVAGKNPFGQSLINGEGANYAQQYAALCGETVGELPVGIQTRGNEDQPYWPMANYATYKEIWMSTAGHWMRLMAELY